MDSAKPRKKKLNKILLAGKMKNKMRGKHSPEPLHSKIPIFPETSAVPSIGGMLQSDLPSLKGTPLACHNQKKIELPRLDSIDSTAHVIGQSSNTLPDISPKKFGKFKAANSTDSFKSCRAPELSQDARNMRQELSEKLNLGSPTKLSSLPWEIPETESDPLTDRVAKDSCSNKLEIGSVDIEPESSEASLC